MTTVMHCRDQGRFPREQVVYIGRPSKWGNPFRIGTHGDRAQVVDRFRHYWNSEACRELRRVALVELKDKILVCYCAPLACHGDVIAEYVNVEVPE